MPATAVGSANGRSTSASTIRRPGNSYRTSTHATSSPHTALTIAAASDAPKVSQYDARTRGDVTAVQNAGQVIDAVFKNAAASGISTIMLRYSSVKPSARSKPGSTLWRWSKVRDRITVEGATTKTAC